MIDALMGENADDGSRNVSGCGWGEKWRTERGTGLPKINAARRVVNDKCETVANEERLEIEARTSSYGGASLYARRYWQK